MSSLGEHFACTRRVQRPGRGGRRKGNEPSWLLAPEHLVSSPRTIIHSHYMWHPIITRHITSHQVILRQKTRGNVSPGHWSSSKHPRKSKKFLTTGRSGGPQSGAGSIILVIFFFLIIAQARCELTRPRKMIFIERRIISRSISEIIFIEHMVQWQAQ